MGDAGADGSLKVGFNRKLAAGFLRFTCSKANSASSWHIGPTCTMPASLQHLPVCSSLISPNINELFLAVQCCIGHSRLAAGRWVFRLKEGRL
jgi:hypothetical protein